MKKVLIIGHFWPYRGGSGRMLGLVKYLPEFCWEPIVLTGPLKQRPDPGLGFKFIETDYLGFLGSWAKFLGIRQNEDVGDRLKEKFEKTPSKIKLFLKFIYNIIKEVFAYPDEDKNWKKFAIDAAENLLKKEKIEAIMSIWPVTSHIIARELKKKYKIPWVADFPDPWSQNQNYPYGFIRKYFDKRLELETISKADIITTAAPLYQKKQEKLHKRQVILITHGFDLENLNKNGVFLDKKFTIIYTGTIYVGKQDPEKFFIAIENLISKKVINADDLEVSFYGDYQGWLQDKIKKHNLEDIVKQRGKISREESLKKQKEAQILLYLNWEDPKEKGVYASKIFEYLSSQRPILATGGFSQDCVEKIITDTKSGIYTVTIEEIEDKLSDFYKEYKNNGAVSYSGNLEEINKYSYRVMAEKFANVLNKTNEK